MSADLRARYERAWAAIGCHGPLAHASEKLLAAWSEPGRAYHDVSHLEACLAHFDEVREHAMRPAVVELALFFHDAVYDTRAVDNEARSAAWAREALTGGGAPGDTIDGVVACVMGTRLSAETDDPDALLMVDIDRAILGADREAFDAYERGVREEYAWVDEEHYAAARIGVLERFLAQKSIFKTRACARLEEAARANIARSIAALGAR